MFENNLNHKKEKYLRTTGKAKDEASETERNHQVAGTPALMEDVRKHIYNGCVHCVHYCKLQHTLF